MPNIDNKLLMIKKKRADLTLCGFIKGAMGYEEIFSVNYGGNDIAAFRM
jgi:hypothetical protein